MEMDEEFSISPRKVEYLKFLGEREGVVRTNEIASRFGVDPSTITKVMGELSELGLVTHIPYRGVRLSEEGRQYTRFLLKRHRILSLMLTHFGLSREQACREASRFESMVSKETVDRICRSMGHPREGGCGEIPHDPACISGGSLE